MKLRSGMWINSAMAYVLFLPAVTILEALWYVSPISLAFKQGASYCRKKSSPTLVGFAGFNLKEVCDYQMALLIAAVM